MSDSQAGGGWMIGCFLLVPFVLLMALVLSMIMMFATEDTTDGPNQVANTASLNVKSVPAEYVPWLEAAGKVCPEISAPMVAAQIAAESGFRDHSPNFAGAAGPAQFLQSTWVTYGVDADGDGVKNLHSVADSVVAMATYDCRLAALFSSRYPKADLWTLVLAGYNAGEGAVIASGGNVPPYTETQNYVAKIKASLGKYANTTLDVGNLQLLPGPCPLGSSPEGVSCDQALAFGKQQMDSGSYAWAGMCLRFVTTAYGGTWIGIHDAATAANIVAANGLMHPVTDAASIPRGAVVWWTGGSQGYGHVAISAGGGQIVSSDAPSFDGSIGLVPLSWFEEHWPGVHLVGWSEPRRG